MTIELLNSIFSNEKTHLKNQYMEEYHNEKFVENILKSFPKTLLEFESFLGHSKVHLITNFCQ
jgi:hypothetical protein